METGFENVREVLVASEILNEAYALQKKHNCDLQTALKALQITYSFRSTMQDGESMSYFLQKIYYELNRISNHLTGEEY